MSGMGRFLVNRIALLIYSRSCCMQALCKLSFPRQTCATRCVIVQITKGSEQRSAANASVLRG